MKHKALKVGFTAVVILGSFLGLLYSTMAESTEYYKHVEEVMGAPDAWYGKNLQLHGFVVPDSIMRKRNSLEYRFKVQSQGQIVDASYTGVVPDTFKSDAEVVLKGVLSHDGFAVHPNGVMAKCPSKYEAKVGAPSAAAAAARNRTE
ncbi:MAG: cytochrome c maturation protein CcmE [Acidobacteriota bacterium]